MFNKLNFETIFVPLCLFPLFCAEGDLVGRPSPFREVLECSGGLWNVLPGSPLIPPPPLPPPCLSEPLSASGGGSVGAGSRGERLSPGEGGLEQVFCLFVPVQSYFNWPQGFCRQVLGPGPFPLGMWHRHAAC